MTATGSSTAPGAPAYRGAARGGAGRRARSAPGPPTSTARSCCSSSGCGSTGWRKVRHWGYVARQMPAMLRELAALPDSPLLACRSWVTRP